MQLYYSFSRLNFLNKKLHAIVSNIRFQCRLACQDFHWYKNVMLLATCTCVQKLSSIFFFNSPVISFCSQTARSALCVILTHAGVFCTNVMLSIKGQEMLKQPSFGYLSKRFHQSFPSLASSFLYRCQVIQTWQKWVTISCNSLFPFQL